MDEGAMSLELLRGLETTAGVLAVAAALLLVKYCLLGGSTVGGSPSSESCTTFGVVDCLDQRGTVTVVLDSLRSGD